LSGSGDRPGPNGREAEPEELSSLSLDDAVGETLEMRSLAELLGERYTPISRLGEGTFGEVIRARDGVLGREVAVKRVRLEAFSAPGQIEEVKTRFLREAQVAARLRHPNIVTTHDIVSGPRSSFIVMELVEGRDLQSRLRERGRLGLEETLDVLGQVAAALDHAHSCGVVHRDVKPANIMIEPSGHVKVMDFGIAKVEQGGNLTSTGLIMGTPNYMSPEQAKGAKVDARADVFSLGCVLYECVSGAKPFHADSVSGILLKVVMEPAPPIDFEGLGLPPALDGVLRSAMAKEPDQRLPSAGALVEAARRAAHGTPVAPPPVGPGDTLVATPAVVASGRPPRPWAGTRASSPSSWALRTAGVVRKRLSRPLAALVVAVMAAAVVGVVALGTRSASRSPAPGAEGRLVVEEEPGFFGRLLGQSPRLLITLPRETTLSLEMKAPVGSATARPGDEIAAEVVEPVIIEGEEAIGTGARARGRVDRVQSAAEAGGRGRLTLDFHTIVLTDGARVEIESDPVELLAPRPRPTTSRRKGLAGAWSRVTDTVGDIVREAKGEGDGRGVSGAHAVQGAGGVDVVLPAGSTMDIELTRPVTLTRARAR
jgi:tRNA A-37 threonylcarbamoyl transferase component Bud32